MDSDGILTLWFSDTYVYIKGPNIKIDKSTHQYFNLATDEIQENLNRIGNDGKMLIIGKNAYYESLWRSSPKSRRVSCREDTIIRSNIINFPFAFSSTIDTAPYFDLISTGQCFEEWLSSSIAKEIDSFSDSSKRVFVFTVNEDGAVNDIECSFDSSIKRGFYEEKMETDILIMNILRKSPIWTPAMVDGQCIKTKLYTEVQLSTDSHPVVKLYR